MNLDLQDAIFCAALILQHAGVDLKMPAALPEFQQRLPSKQELARPDIPDDAIGLFYPVGKKGLAVANSWPVLVHEATHELEFANKLPLREDWAYFAEGHAYQCSFHYDPNVGGGEGWVVEYDPQ